MTGGVPVVGRAHDPVPARAPTRIARAARRECLMRVRLTWWVREHSQADDSVAELYTVNDVHSASHATERREISFVVRLRRVVQRVARTSRVEASAGPRQIAARKAMTVHLVALNQRVANRRFLIDEVRHNARELAAHDRALIENACERVHGERRVGGVELELDLSARG